MEPMETASEHKVMANVLAHLHDRFPDVPAETVESEVRSRFGAYAGSRVRDFLPTLVEREVAANLAAHDRGRRQSA